MKTKYLTGLILIFLLFPKCTNDFENINIDKHEFVNVEPEFLMSSVVKNSMNLFADMNANVYWPFSHQLTVSGMGSTASYGASYSAINTWWRQFYESISLLRQIQKKYEDDENYKNRIEIAKIWESYMFYIFTTTFGGVPYQFASRDDLIEIPFDKENDIYKNILDVLKTASENLDPEGDKLSPDILFTDSDINKWKQFAVALRLKIALETQNAIPEDASSHGKDVMTNFQDLLIKSNQDNIQFKWGGTNTTENSYYFDTFLLNSTKELPALSHLMFLYYRTYKDPRMETIFDRTQGQFLIFDSLYTDNTHTEKKLYRYEVPYNGKEKTTQKADLGENDGYVEEVADPYRSMNPTQYSYLKKDFLKESTVQNLIWYSDVCFMQAEAKQLNWGGSKTSEQYYNDGIKASFEYFGLSTNQADNYINQNGVKWNTQKLDALPDHRMLVNANITNDPIHKIIVQRWLAGIIYGSHDAYCYIRRTRKIELLPHFAPSTDVNGAGTRIANLPERIQYPNSEITYNNKEYMAAVKNLNSGFDFLSTYLNLSKEYNRKTYEEWRVVNLRINNRAWIKWYGDTVDDLIEAGLVKDVTFFEVADN